LFAKQTAARQTHNHLIVAHCNKRASDHPGTHCTLVRLAYPILLKDIMLSVMMWLAMQTHWEPSLAKLHQIEQKENLTQNRKRPTNERGWHIGSCQIRTIRDRNNGQTVLTYADMYRIAVFRRAAYPRHGRGAQRNLKPTYPNGYMMRKQHGKDRQTTLSVSAVTCASGLPARARRG
jgi:hypothetical protein